MEKCYNINPPRSGFSKFSIDYLLNDACPAKNKDVDVVPALVFSDENDAYSDGVASPSNNQHFYHSSFDSTLTWLGPVVSESDQIFQNGQPTSVNLNLFHDIDNSMWRFDSVMSLEASSDAETEDENDFGNFCNDERTEKLARPDYWLCVVCGDRASGVHYKVAACDGCKGFFRRSIYRDAKYKCHKSGRCWIDKWNRNRCQSCRLQKCFYAGMCKETVKRDRKRKLLRTRLESPDLVLPEMPTELQCIVNDAISAHRETYTPTDIHALKIRQDNSMGCILLWAEDSDLSTMAVHQVIAFAKKTHRFITLCSEDQILLLKSSCLEVMFLRFSSRYFPGRGSIVLPSGSEMTTQYLAECLGEISDDIIQLAEMLIEINLDETELALLQCMCIMCPDRTGLTDRQLVQEACDHLITAFTLYACHRRLTRPLLMSDIISFFFALRHLGVKGASVIQRPQEISLQ